jgi:hypothetical protein
LNEAQKDFMPIGMIMLSRAFKKAVFNHCAERATSSNERNVRPEGSL